MKFRIFDIMLPVIAVVASVLISCSHSQPKSALGPAKELKVECTGAGCSIIFSETNISIENTSGSFKAVAALRRTSSGDEKLFILGDTAGTLANGFKTGKWDFEDMSVFRFGGKTLFRASGFTAPVSGGEGRAGLLYVYRIDQRHGTLDPVSVRYPDFKGLLRKGESAGPVQSIKFQDGRVAGAVSIIPGGGEIDVKYRIGKAPDGEFSMYPFSIKVRRKHQ
jgi:hypothetical protein